MSPPKKTKTHLPTNQQIGPSARCYPTRTRAPFVRLKDFWSLLSKVIEEPINFSKASSQKEWKMAIENKVKSTLKNKTWDIID